MRRLEELAGHVSCKATHYWHGLFGCATLVHENVQQFSPIVLDSFDNCCGMGRQLSTTLHPNTLAARDAVELIPDELLFLR